MPNTKRLRSIIGTEPGWQGRPPLKHQRHIEAREMNENQMAAHIYVRVRRPCRSSRRSCRSARCGPLRRSAPRPSGHGRSDRRRGRDGGSRACPGARPAASGGRVRRSRHATPCRKSIGTAHVRQMGGALVGGLCRADGAGIRGRSARGHRARVAAACAPEVIRPPKDLPPAKSGRRGRQAGGFGDGGADRGLRHRRRVGTLALSSPCRGTDSGASRCRARCKSGGNARHEGMGHAGAGAVGDDIAGAGLRGHLEETRDAPLADRDRDRLCRHLNPLRPMIRGTLRAKSAGGIGSISRRKSARRAWRWSSDTPSPCSSRRAPRNCACPRPMAVPPSSHSPSGSSRWMPARRPCS